MDFFHTDLIRPLIDAENVFLEVLLSNFTLSRAKGDEGVTLEVAFKKDSPAAWNRQGRETVKSRMGANPVNVDRYKKELDAILLEGECGAFSPNDPDFLWRWASAGTLPIISIGDKDYYCFFYRDIFPIGWNIANGATDTRAELLDPLLALERELGEELVVASRKKKARYVLKPNKDQSLDQAAFGNFRRLWKEEFPEIDLLNYKTKGLAFTWDVGPDLVEVKTNYGERTLKDCFVNINAADFGIELDRIARIAITDDALLCDGECSEGWVLNRPVGLFEVGRFQQEVKNGKSSFLPDKFFHSGVKHEREAGENDDHFKQRLLDPVKKDVYERRSPTEIKAFDKAAKERSNVGLCPVTDSIVRRHAKYIRQLTRGSKIREVADNYKVFLSFGGLDQAIAQRVFESITKETGRKVFFAPQSLPEHPGLWSVPIYAALRSASHFVVVATRPENLGRGWVNFEINNFRQRHPERGMISMVSGFSPQLLPDPLFSFEALTWSDEPGFQGALQKLKVWLCS